MKKKIVIVTRQMIMGGIEKALLSMLESIPKDEYDITLLVMARGGELFEEIPKHINVKCLYGEENSTLQKTINYIKNGKFIMASKVVYNTLFAKIAKSVFEQEMYHCKMIPIEKQEYDIAIAYHVPHSLPVVYVINNINAKHKIAWIHSDVSNYKKELIPYRTFYEKYDKIFCVSKYGRDKFIELYPNLEEKTKVFYNIIDIKKLECLSNEGFGFNDNFVGIRLLTVGRLTHEKGQDIIPYVVKKLKKNGLNVRWYCIGDGDEKINLKKIIQSQGLEKDIILFGTKSNPYPYFKECDIYVQTSRHEGYCITLAEARIFNKPIITTNFIGAREQIINENNGLIVEFNEDKIYTAIDRIIKNSDLKNKFKKNLHEEKHLIKQNLREIF